jgi:hypothetical protein
MRAGVVSMCAGVIGTDPSLVHCSNTDPLPCHERSDLPHDAGAHWHSRPPPRAGSRYWSRSSASGAAAGRATSSATYARTATRSPPPPPLAGPTHWPAISAADGVRDGPTPSRLASDSEGGPGRTPRRRRPGLGKLPRSRRLVWRLATVDLRAAGPGRVRRRNTSTAMPTGIMIQGARMSESSWVIHDYESIPSPTVRRSSWAIQR